jgi:ABC-type dipeptide/oligopeptide/nickel transport system ATPase component
MYAGKIVERAPVLDIFDTPAHPYSKSLLDAAFGLHLQLDTSIVEIAVFLRLEYISY